MLTGWKKAGSAMINNLPLVSVIILNYNGKKYLDELLDKCIAAVLESDYVDIELIFVDNGSTDGSINHVRERFGGDRRMKIVRLEKNYGTAKGKNEGIRNSRGAIIFLLNNDTLIPKNAIRRVVDALQIDKKVGIAGCKIVSPNGETQTEGVKFRKFLTIFEVLFENVFSDKTPSLYENLKGVKRVDWVWGTAIMIKKDVIEKIGLHDENYYAYSEEIDFCYRAKKSGFEVLSVTDVRIVHYGGVTSEHFPVWRTDLIWRNKLLFVLKHFSPIAVFIAFFINFLDVLRLLALGFLERDKYRLQVAKSKLKAYSYIKKEALSPK